MTNVERNIQYIMQAYETTTSYNNKGEILRVKCERIGGVSYSVMCLSHLSTIKSSHLSMKGYFNRSYFFPVYDDDNERMFTIGRVSGCS